MSNFQKVFFETKCWAGPVVQWETTLLGVHKAIIRKVWFKVGKGQQDG